MPKIIENLQSKLIAETQRQLAESGYSAVTVRSVAGACGVGIGTVYNYFPSKEALIAAFLLEDWTQCIARIRDAGARADDPREVAHCIYRELSAFSLRHSAIFRDPAAAASLTGSFGRYHRMLRDQLAQPLRRFCDSDFTAQFASESLLVWTVAEKPFDEIYGVLGRLF